jgi:hypothetical protein
LALVSAEACAFGQFAAEDSKGPKLGDPHTQLLKVGLVIHAQNAPRAQLFGTAAVPMDWPEQRVKIANEEISLQVRQLRYRTLEGGVKQMLVQIPRLEARETATALVTFEVTKNTLLPPDNPDEFTTPKNPPRDVRKHLAPSPLIESRHSSIRSQLKEIVRQEDNAWRQVESICDWVRDRVQQRNGKVKGALAALRDGCGNYEDATSLFIALCRAAKIPARTVWVPDHCYAEFYLDDSEGKGHWIPCQLSGEREFGCSSDRRPIMQKGDNITTPETREPQRFVGEFFRCDQGRGSGKPSLVTVRQLLPGP